ncbi:MAG: hypothetical protein NW206_12460 [Hyphomonadaceae bacterium]|nr:hypothetical protein [Hyphomonadaceae bacterium]
MPAQVELAALPARASPHAPNAALADDAGVFAPAIARVWPRPHTAYFNAEAPRRRLAGLIADRAREAPGALAEALETWSLKRLVAAYLPEAPHGFVEAVRKIEDAGWTGEDFRRLSFMLSEAEASKTLRHARAITRRFVATLVALPQKLRRSRIVAHVPTPQVADLVARGVKRACARDEQAIGRLADRLERARSPQTLIRMLIDAIGLERLAPPPVPGTDWFVPLASSAKIESAALRFENCLKGRIPLMLWGKGAYYEVVGDEPAIVEIVRDANGLWVAGEVRGHANADISAELWARIRAHLELHGARTRYERPDALAVALANAAGW